MTVAGAEGLSGDFQLFSGISWLSGLHVILLVTQVLREWALYPFVNARGRRHSKVPVRGP